MRFDIISNTKISLDCPSILQLHRQPTIIAQQHHKNRRMDVTAMHIEDRILGSAAYEQYNHIVTRHNQI